MLDALTMARSGMCVNNGKGAYASSAMLQEVMQWNVQVGANGCIIRHACVTPKTVINRSATGQSLEADYSKTPDNCREWRGMRLLYCQPIDPDRSEVTEMGDTVLFDTYESREA